jgi:predicted TIM-barrel fold metal-dependent hydrolase
VAQVTRTESERDAKGSLEIRGGVIDCDVHPVFPPEGMKLLSPYLTSGWRKRFEMRGLDTIYTTTTGRTLYPFGGRNHFRVTATPPGGGLPGSDPNHMAKQLFDELGIARALLLPIEGCDTNGWANPAEATVVAAAFNDYYAEHWLGADSRFRYAMIVNSHDPEGAAAEIRRFGKTPGVAAVWLQPTNNILIGKPVYNLPIAVAVEVGLPIVMHPNASDGNLQGNGIYAGGVASTFGERQSGFAGLAAAIVSSAIFDGVFERYPSLKIVLCEYGWAWVAAHVWRMDAIWKGQRADAPWVKRPPAEYVLESVRFSSQPATHVPDEFTARMLEMIHADRTLVFSSDYPHFDGDEGPELDFKNVSTELRQRIFHDNALEALPGLA